MNAIIEGYVVVNPDGLILLWTFGKNERESINKFVSVQPDFQLTSHWKEIYEPREDRKSVV